MSTKPTTQDETPTEKLPYEKPSAVAEETFETLALSCARENGFICPNTVPNNS